VATTPNQTAVAEVISALDLSSPLYHAVLFAGEENAPLALDMLSGEVHASAQTHLAQTTQFALNAARDHGTDQTATGRGVWGIALGRWDQNQTDGNAATMTGSVYGVFAGVDLLQTPGFELGLMTGFTGSSFNIDDRNSSGTTTALHGGIYGNAQIDAFSLNFGAMYSGYDVNTTRIVMLPDLEETLIANYGATALSVSAEASYKFERGANQISPFIGGSYTHLNVDAFTETGGVAALSGEAASFDVFTSTLGVRVARDFTLGENVVRGTGTLGWQHVFGGTTPMSELSFEGQPAFTIAGVPMASDVLVVGLGAVLELNERSTLSADYFGQFGTGQQTHAASLTYEFRF